MRRHLTTSYLLTNGFEEIGCWTASERRLDPPSQLPSERGVYAFAVDDEVLYVGLASRSLRQRLGFYARPGASQRTNVRLNGLIRGLIESGSTVRVLLARPKDGNWNAFRLSGPEGLEAALIEDFDLPWNVKGSIGEILVPKATPTPSRVRRTHGSVPQAIVNFVTANPKSTELQIARGVFGPDAVQPQANAYCRKLVERGTLERLPTRPATYLLKK